MTEGNLTLFTTIFEQTPVSTQIFTPDGDTITVNKAWEKLWNVTFNQIKSYNILQDRQLIEKGVMPYIKRAFKGEIVSLPSIRYEPSKTVNVKNAVPYRWLSAQMYPIRDKNKKITHVVLQHKDITDKRDAEVTNNRLAAIVESSDDAIISKNLQGIINSWNKSAQKLFGYLPEEIIGKHITTIIPPELQSEEATIIKKIKKGLRIQHFETTRLTKNKKRVQVSLSISPIKDIEGTIIGASKIARDITKQKKLEREKNDFLSMASHELRTPLTSMKMFIDLLDRELEKDEIVKSKYYITRIQDQADKLKKLTEELLDVSRIETGKLIPKKDTFLLDELIRETVESMQATTQRHSIGIRGEKNRSIIADRYRIYQVLVNLISNAIKYSPSGGKITVSSTTKDQEIIISVKDTGIGIPQKLQKKIFEKLYQVEEKQAKTYPGLGLGLYISKEIVEQHGGKIWLQSIRGKGTTFYFSLPM